MYNVYLLSAIYISTKSPVHHNKNVHYLYPPYPYPSWYGPYLTCHNIKRVLGECWPYKKLATNLISLKNLKMLVTDPLTQGQDWVRGDAIASRKKYFPKSQFYKVEFVYGAVFLVCIISSKNAQTKFHAWKLEARVHNFDIPEWLQSTMCTLCTRQIQKLKVMI